MKEFEIEIWKDIEGYEGLYQVSNMGNVKSLNYKRSGKERLLKPRKNKLGYMFVGLYKDNKPKNFRVHRLVAMTFLENPNNLSCVNHKDENPSNNHVDNLEFCTHEYNMNYGTIKERKSKKMKGKFKSENHPMYGKHHTEESKQKMSEANKGKMSGENHPFYGKHHTEETKQKISQARKGKRNKPILQYSLIGEFIREWESITQVNKELNIDNSSITKCCKEKQKSAYGYIWRYKE